MIEYTCVVIHMHVYTHDHCFVSGVAIVLVNCIITESLLTGVKFLNRSSGITIDRRVQRALRAHEKSRAKPRDTLACILSPKT